MKKPGTVLAVGENRVPEILSAAVLRLGVSMWDLLGEGPQSTTQP